MVRQQDLSPPTISGCNCLSGSGLSPRDMAFRKRGGLRIEDMVRSRRVYRKLRNFRAGIESGISCLKRAYGLARCTWRGRDRFRAYGPRWSLTNLALLARLKRA